MSKKYDSEYEIQQDILTKLGGDGTKCFDSQYSILLEILDKIEGGGGGAVIDDSSVSTSTTWSSSKIVSELASAGFDIEIVSELPTTGDPHTIYFIASSSSVTGNVYDEYMYINGNWEQVGSTSVDLSQYATKEWVNTSLGNYATKNDISTFITSNDVSIYAEKTYVDASLANKANASDLNAYATIANVNSSLATKQDTLTAGSGINITNNVISATSGGSADYIIADADASAGTYSNDISAFYHKSITEDNVQSVQIHFVDEHIVNNASVYTDSYYLPSSSRIYDGNVELWLMYTEDGATWENIHYLITDSTIARDTSTGSFGISNPLALVTLTQAEYDALITKDASTLYVISDAQ